MGQLEYLFFTLAMLFPASVLAVRGLHSFLVS